MKRVTLMLKTLHTIPSRFRVDAPKAFMVGLSILSIGLLAIPLLMSYFH